MVKGRIAGVEILAVQVLLRPTEGITDLTISNKCYFRLVAQGFYALFGVSKKCLKWGKSLFFCWPITLNWKYDRLYFLHFVRPDAVGVLIVDFVIFCALGDRTCEAAAFSLLSS